MIGHGKSSVFNTGRAAGNTGEFRFWASGADAAYEFKPLNLRFLIATKSRFQSNCANQDLHAERQAGPLRRASGPRGAPKKVANREIGVPRKTGNQSLSIVASALKGHESPVKSHESRHF